ncbi:MAG: hypothetical protein FWG87_08745 [Defluviitaleaceae bacterium]|nr:hypothetical protein [Defluviitaleaceae bacterium]
MECLKALRENRFTIHSMNANPTEQLFAEDWDTLIQRHNGHDWQLLRNMFIELNFPIIEGQSKNPLFAAALRRGQLPPICEGEWIPANPEGVRLYLHPTPVGRLPVIECEADEDFVRLMQSLVYRCEPRSVPDSRGAGLLKNYNNWARIRMRGGSIPKDSTLYKDCIALLSHRYYSGTEPELFGLTPQEWRLKSLVIRREHEAAHYMTQRYYHSAKSEIHDELIADFMGLTAAFGFYEPNFLLAFLGLYPTYRKGGRLAHYLEKEGFDELCGTIVQAARSIGDCYEKTGCRMAAFHILCRTSVADMARGRFNC